LISWLRASLTPPAISSISAAPDAALAIHLPNEFAFSRIKLIPPPRAKTWLTRTPRVYLAQVTKRNKKQ
jgi:hypothetical protein